MSAQAMSSQEHANRRARPRPTSENVGTLERWASLIGGTALVGFGLARRSWGGVAAAIGGAALLHRGATGSCSAYRALGVNTAGHQPREIRSQIRLACEPEVAYRFWRDPQQIACLLNHRAEISVLEPGLALWQVTLPGGARLSWKERLIADDPGARLAMETVAGGDLSGCIEMRFSPSPDRRGTDVRLRLAYRPTGDLIHQTLLLSLGPVARQFLHEVLRRSKQLIETGEIATTEGQTSGRRRAEAVPRRPEPESAELSRDRAVNEWRARERSATPAAPAPAPGRIGTASTNESDLVSESSDESFPASDPPPWNSSSVGKPNP